MALVNINGVIDAIRWPPSLWDSVNFSSLGMTTAGSYWALTFIVPKAGTLSKFHFRTIATATGGNVHVSFQNVDIDGKPDGIVDQFRLVAVADLDDNVWKASGIISSDGTDIGTKRSVVAGDRLCVVLRWDSFTVESTQFTSVSDTDRGCVSAIYRSTDSGATWALQTGSFVGALEYDDGTIAYLKDTVPVDSPTTAVITEASTPDEYCLRFRLPFPARVSGVAVYGEGLDTQLSLYPDSGAALASGRPEVGSTASQFRHEVHFTTAIDLTANTWYRIGWKPTSGATTTIRLWPMTSAAYREAFDLGLNFALGSRADAGVWTDDDTKFIVATLLASGFEDGTGAAATCSYGAIPNGTRVIPAVG